MTIREGERVRRKAPGRTGPTRSGSLASGADADRTRRAASPQDPSVSEAVAHAVRMGYDVIAENIQLGREAAARFRQGEYNIRDVPHDAEVALTRMVNLARELTSTTFEVLEKVLKEAATLQPPNGGAGLPPFRAPGEPQTAKPAGETGRLQLTVEFDGGAKGVSRTSTLDRPRRPAAPDNLFATPLTLPGAEGAAISAVCFEMKVGIDGVIAVVTAPKGLPPGVYSGLAYVRGDDVPLGVLSVEIRE